MKKTTESYSLETSQQVAEYRAHLERSANLRSQRDQLKQLIQGKNNEIAEAGTNIPDISHLSIEREDMLADIALGKANTGDLAALDEKIGGIRNEHQAIAASAKESILAAEQVIAGLQRRIAPIESELQAVAATENSLLSKVVIEYAESLGAEYAEAALRLKELFFRLMAMDGIIRDAGIRKMGISAHTAAAMCIPTFNLQAVTPHEMRTWPGNICYFPSFPTSEISQAYEHEMRHLLAAGIELHPV